MDGFVNGITTTTIDDPWWVERAKNADLLVIHVIFRRLQSSEPLKQDDPLSLLKIAGEGQLFEYNFCLGWEIQTRSLQGFPPRGHSTPKYPCLQKKMIYTMESLIGKLNHSTHVIPPESYFLNWLHQLLKRGKKWGQQRLYYWNRQYLHLWIKIFQWVTDKRVPINNIVFTTPTVTT